MFVQCLVLLSLSFPSSVLCSPASPFFCFSQRHTHGETGVLPVSSSLCVCVCVSGWQANSPEQFAPCSSAGRPSPSSPQTEDVARRWNADPNPWLESALLLTFPSSPSPLALSQQKMKTLAQRRQSAPSLVISKALTRSRSTSR